MVKLSSKKRYAIIPLLIGTLLIAIFKILPLVQYIDKLIDLYEPVLDEKLPIVQFYDGRIDIEGELPHKVTLENGAYVLFDSIYNDSLFKDLPATSLFISERDIRIKTKAEIVRLSLDKIILEDKGESMVLEPLRLREKIQRYRNLAIIIIDAALFFLIAMSLTGIALLAAGIGFMIDAFTQGAFTFGELLNFASFTLLFFIFLWIIFGSNSMTVLKIFVIFYFAIMTAFVYLRVFIKRSLN